MKIGLTAKHILLGTMFLFILALTLLASFQLLNPNRYNLSAKVASAFTFAHINLDGKSPIINELLLENAQVVTIGTHLGSIREIQDEGNGILSVKLLDSEELEYRLYLSEDIDTKVYYYCNPLRENKISDNCPDNRFVETDISLLEVYDFVEIKNMYLISGEERTYLRTLYLKIQ